MRNLFFSICVLFITTNCFGQQINFFDNLSGSVGGQVFLGSYTDDDLNLYVSGQVAGTTLHLFNYTYGTPFSGSYSFLVKFNPAHQVVWFRYFQCYGGATKKHGLVADDDGNVYFSVEHGNTNAPIDVYTSDGTFIIKLDQYGVVQWFRPYHADNLRLISNNRIQLIGASNDNDLVEGTYPITNPSGTVITLDTAGTYQSHVFIDLPAYQSERILGVNNQNQFYGYRASNGTPTLVSGFLADSTGAIAYSKRINYCQSSSLPFSMTYDPTTEQYYVAGRLEVNIPMDTNVNVAPFGNQNSIMKLDDQFQILGRIPLTVMNGNGGTAGLVMQTKNGDLMVGGKISTSGLAHTHIGPHFYLNYDDDNLWLAKIDQNLQFKWCRSFVSSDYSNRFSDLWLHDQYIAMGGNAGLIPGIPPPYNTFNGGDMFVGFIKDLDSTDIELAGKVFYDHNLNGVQDTLEPGISSMQCTNTDTSAISFSNSQGAYALTGQWGNNLIRSLTIPMYWFYTTPDTIQLNISSFDTSITNLQFGAAPLPNVVDLRIRSNDYHPAVMAHSYPIKLDYYNLGTDTNDVEIIFIKDPLLTYNGSSIAPDLISGDTLKWNINSLHFFNEGSIIVNTTTPANPIYFGDSVINYVSINTLLADTFSYDNFDTVISILISPVDPNDKTSKPENCFYEPFIQNDQAIEYTIRFQNTGTAQAINVYLVDTLSALLDPSTIQIVSSSHPCYPVYEMGVLKFFFDNINLPDTSVSLDASCGYVKFSIQPDSNLVNGDLISNSAEIYFDFNPPIYTGATHLQYYDSPIQINVEHPTCPGMMDGVIQISPWCAQSSALLTSMDGMSFDTIGVYSMLGEGIYPIYIIQEGDTIIYTNIQLMDPPEVVIDSVEFINTICGDNNGMIDIYASSGIPPLTYSINGLSFLPNSAFINLAEGVYPIQVQDSMGCLYSWSDSIQLNSLYDLMIDSVIATPSSCNDDSTGTLEIFTHGEYSMVYYSLNGSAFVTNSLLTNLPANNYQVIVMDSMCYDTSVVTIPSISNLNANITSTNVNTLPVNGSITVHAFDGLEPYYFALNGGVYGPDSIFTNLAEGSYTIDISDSMGCIQSFTVNIYNTLMVEGNIENEYFIYPNPTYGEIYVKELIGDDEVSYYLYNLYGQLMVNGVFDQSHKIDIIGLPSGTYVLRINDKHWKVVKLD